MSSWFMQDNVHRLLCPNAKFCYIRANMVSLLKGKVEHEIDALFRLPLAEFTSARNALAARLKKDGRTNEADRVKSLVKPSVSAWAVNQLYWNHREDFDQLIATGKRLRPTQTSRRAGKVADMRDSIDARREALANLSDVATDLLRDAGHNPSLDTMRRITATLEALSGYALLSGGPTPGRLTQDVDPPSFESLASLMSGGGKVAQAPEPPRITPSKIRQTKIAAAKVSLQEAKAAHRNAQAEAKEAEKHRREAEERLEKVTSAAKDAAQVEQDAKRIVEEATKELESLLATDSHG
jgi:hypothetical protein